MKRLASGFALAALLLLFVLGCSRSEAKETHLEAATARAKVIRIVRPKQLVGLSVLEKRGALEKKLAPLGYKVEWLEFAAGPQQLEAIRAGGLDIALTAESPPVFAQAAEPNGPVVYLATTSPSGRSVSLLVSPDSPAKTMLDLKGKKIAYQKASIGHYLTYRALERVGLTLDDVESIHLPPPDANVAFAQKKVDAWFIWEPFGTRAVQSHTGRVLLDGEDLRDTSNFYTTTRSFAENNREALKIFLSELQDVERWCRDNPQAMAELLSPTLLIDVPTLIEMHKKYTFGVWPITEAARKKQQEVSDLWFKLGFLPAKTDVSGGFLSDSFYLQAGPPAL